MADDSIDSTSGIDALNPLASLGVSGPDVINGQDTSTPAPTLGQVATQDASQSSFLGLLNTGIDTVGSTVEDVVALPGQIASAVGGLATGTVNAVNFFTQYGLYIVIGLIVLLTVLLIFKPGLLNAFLPRGI